VGKAVLREQGSGDQSCGAVNKVLLVGEDATRADVRDVAACFPAAAARQVSARSQPGFASENSESLFYKVINYL
jgi:hypothetical protein